ncbi:MAG: TolC family protein [Chlamydiae bacterium]|nr:TolC family protein [Chlamydiota bacterium]MBI3267295.1 TolC family protein [Chlamydiota bacterium]
MKYFLTFGRVLILFLTLSSFTLTFFPSENLLGASSNESLSPASDASSSSPLTPEQKTYVKNQLRVGKMAARKGDYKTAYIELKKALLVDPKNKEILRLLDSILQRVPNMEEMLIQEEKAKAAPQTPPPSPVSSNPGNIEKMFDYPSAENEPLPGSGTPLTLEQCIMIARANSLSVKIAREEATLAQAKITPARRALWPSVDAFWKETRGTTTGQDFTGREITLEVQKPLLTWGKNKALYLQAKTNWEIAKRNLQKEVSELDFKVEQAYFILTNALKDVQDLHALHEKAQKDLHITEQKYKMELATELEWLKSKTKVGEIRYRKEAAEKDLILAQLTMTQILDTHQEAPFTIRSVLGPYRLETTLEQCTELAFKNRSDLIVDELLIEYNQAGQKIARSEYKWNVSLEGSAGLNDEAFITEDIELEKEWFVGVKVNKAFGSSTLEDNFIAQDKVPSVGQTTATEFQSNTLKWYFWNNTAKIDIKEADIKYLKAIDEYVKKRNSIIFEVKKNYYEYIKAAQQLENNSDKLKVAQKEMRVSEARFELNEVLDSELLDSRDKYSRAQSDYGQSLTGYYTAVANLNKTVGLTDYFDLKRGLQEEVAPVDAWRTYINNPGDVGSLPSTAGYQDVIRRLQGDKPWWQFWDSSKSTTSPKTISGKASTGSQSNETLDVDGWIKKGEVLYQEEKYEEAIEAWNKALELDPQNRRVQIYLERAKKKIKSSSKL